MPKRIKQRLMLVGGVMFIAFLVAFNPIRIGHPEEYRIELTMRFELEEPASKLAPKGQTLDQSVEDALMKAKLEMTDAELIGEHVLVIKGDAKTKGEALRMRERILKLMGEQFPKAHLIESGEREVGIKPLLKLGAINIVTPKPRLNLGLDLQGGARIVLQCKRAEFQYKLAQPIGKEAEKRIPIRHKLIVALRENGLEEFELFIDESVGQFITVRTQAKNKNELNRQARLIEAIFRQQLGTVEEAAKPKLYPFSSDVVNTVIEIIRRRVDRYGVAEAQIYRHGEDKIVVELPGLRHAAEAIKLIGKTAILELKLVPTKYRVSEEGGRTVFRDEQGKIIPPMQVYLESKPVITGKDLKPPCRVTYDEMNRPAVAFTLQKASAKKFAYETGRNIGRHLAIWFDRECVSAPVIRDRISTHGIITGRFTFEEARNLKVLLDAGSLPVPVSVVWNRTISPTLGRDVIHKSTIAGVLGLIAIVVFMVVYYRLPGTFACIALTLYGLLMLAAFSAPIPGWRPTLTLPGVIGFLLSLGMAVDANIIIFERLKEELRSARTLHTAIEVAFNRAWTA
ncbi:MAG: protein translocase subunit SecD, partial [Armatimonadetes bacterium]|nr:protein translocase subunit SecD [Armatimonadota bacterium]